VKLLDITEYHSPVGGGVTTYLKEKARWIAGRTDVEHVIVVSGRDDREETWERSRVHHLGGPPVPASPGFYFLRGAERLAEILDAERPDVIELGSPFFAAWALKRALRRMRTRAAVEGDDLAGSRVDSIHRRPVVVGFFHDDIQSVWVDHGMSGALPWMRRLPRAALGAYVRRIYAPLAHTIAPTAAGERTLRAAGVENVSTIPLGVDTEQFHPSRRDPEWKREVMGAGVRVLGAERMLAEGESGWSSVAPSDPFALYVGRFAREKELGLLLEAVPRLMEIGIRTVLIGEGHMRDAALAVSRAHPAALTMLPFEENRDRLARAYASADLFINPCPWETFGLATLEAMASGLPVVAPDAGGSAEILRQGGGVTFRPGDVTDLVRAAAELLSPSSDPRLAARRRAEQLGWDATFTRQIALYEELLKR
jgi:alpha-1,6-mannosyltransferase